MPDDLYYTLHHHDPQGTLTRAAMMAFNPYNFSPLSWEYLWDLEVRHKIPAAFGGLDYKTYDCGGDICLDSSDPFVYAHAGRNLDRSPIIYVSPESVFIRNKAMAAAAVAAADSLDSRIILVSTTLPCVAGEKPRLSYDESVMAILKAQGHAVMGIYLDSILPEYSASQALSPDALAANPDDLVIIEKLNGGQKYTCSKLDLYEKEAIKGLASHWSGAQHGFPCPFATEPAIPDKAEVRQKIEELITHAIAHPAPAEANYG